MNIENWIFYFFSFICLAAASIIGISLLINRKKLRKIRAIIADTIDTSTNRVPWNSKWATLIYNIDGKKYMSKKRYNVPKFSIAGEEIEIKYLEGHPEKLYIYNIKMFFAFLIGFAFFLLLTLFVK